MRWNRLAGLAASIALAIMMLAPLQHAMAAKPLPSVIAPKAVTSILIDVIHNGKNFVAVGERGHVLLSTDGQNWRQVVSPVSRMLNAVHFIDENTGWATGYDFAIIKTTDGGETWTLQNHEADPGWPFYDVFFLDHQRGFVMGERGTFRVTDDGGASWRNLETDMSELGMHINAMTELADGTLVLVGEKGLTARSSDQGETWTMVTEPYIGSFFGVLPHGDKGFITYGLRGNTYLAEDASALLPQDPVEWDEYGRDFIEDTAKLTELGWKFLPNPVTESLFGGTRLPNGEVVLVGVNGSIVRSDSQAQRMLPVDNPADSTLGAVVLQNGNLIMVGVAGIQRLALR